MLSLLRILRTSRLASEQGLAYVEFALTISILLLLCLGSVEVTRFVLILQKLEKTVETVSDVVTQTNPNSAPLTTTEMSQLMSAIPDLMSPYVFGSNGLVIVSDLTGQASGNPVLNWQYCGGGTLVYTSKFGKTTGAAITAAEYSAFPNGLTLNSGEEVVISEIIYNYAPITTTQWSVLTASQVYRTATFMPRLGALTGFSSHC
jgi:Flp pilus assembly protein TadG